MSTYKIVRMRFEGRNYTIATGLTLEEAQAHCSDPETSSKTCSVEKRNSVRGGTWFEGYEKEK